MEHEATPQITYALTDTNIGSLLTVDSDLDVDVEDDDQGRLAGKSFSGSVSTPAYISTAGFAASSLTINVTDEHGKRVEYKDTIDGDGDFDLDSNSDASSASGDDDAQDGNGSLHVPSLGHFPSTMTMDSIATIGSYDDLASFAASPAPDDATTLAALVATVPVAGPDAGLANTFLAPPTFLVPTATATAGALADVPAVPGPTAAADAFEQHAQHQQAQAQAQHAARQQRFLRFYASQQARHAELFDDDEDVDDEDFDFFGYGRNFRDDYEGDLGAGMGDDAQLEEERAVSVPEGPVIRISDPPTFFSGYVPPPVVEAHHDSDDVEEPVTTGNGALHAIVDTPLVSKDVCVKDAPVPLVNEDKENQKPVDAILDLEGTSAADIEVVVEAPVVADMEEKAHPNVDDFGMDIVKATDKGKEREYDVAVIPAPIPLGDNVGLNVDANITSDTDLIEFDSEIIAVEQVASLAPVSEQQIIFSSPLATSTPLPASYGAANTSGAFSSPSLYSTASATYSPFGNVHSFGTPRMDQATEATAMAADVVEYPATSLDYGDMLGIGSGAVTAAASATTPTVSGAPLSSATVTETSADTTVASDKSTPGTPAPSTHPEFSYTPTFTEAREFSTPPRVGSSSSTPSSASSSRRGASGSLKRTRSSTKRGPSSSKRPSSSNRTASSPLSQSFTPISASASSASRSNTPRITPDSPLADLFEAANLDPACFEGLGFENVATSASMERIMETWGGDETGAGEKGVSDVAEDVKADMAIAETKTLVKDVVQGIAECAEKEQVAQVNINVEEQRCEPNTQVHIATTVADHILEPAKDVIEAVDALKAVLVEDENDEGGVDGEGDDSFSRLNGSNGVKIQHDKNGLDVDDVLTSALQKHEQFRRDCIALASWAYTPLTVRRLDSDNTSSDDVFPVSGNVVDEPTSKALILGSGVGDVTALASAPVEVHFVATVPVPEEATRPQATVQDMPTKCGASATVKRSDKGFSDNEDSTDTALPTDDIAGYINSIPGPECMPTFAAVVLTHLEPAPTAPRSISPAPSFAIPVISDADGTPLLSEVAPELAYSSSLESGSSNGHGLPNSPSVDTFNVPTADLTLDIPSLLAEPCPFNDLPASASSSGWSFGSTGIDNIADADAGVDMDEDVSPAITPVSSKEDITEAAIQSAQPPTTLDTILEESDEGEGSEQAAVPKNALSNDQPPAPQVDSESAYDGDEDEAHPDDAVGPAMTTPVASLLSLSLSLAPSPLVTVYEELSGGPQHVINSLPRYAMRSLETLPIPPMPIPVPRAISSPLKRRGKALLRSHPWLAVLAGKKGHTESSRSKAVSTGTVSDSSSAAPAAVLEDDRWSLLTSPRPDATSASLQTPVRQQSTGSSIAGATPSSFPPSFSTPSSSSALRKRQGEFFMTRMSMCPSPSPKRTRSSTSGPTSSSAPTSSPCASALPTSAPPLSPPTEKDEGKTRSVGRIRLVLRKIRTLF